MDKTLLNIFWFKRDLRLEDNDALLAALQSTNPLLLIYIYEPSLQLDPHYSERHWQFVFESLKDLQKRLAPYNTEVIIFEREVISCFESLLEHFNIENVYSTEETGIELTYARDISFAEFCDERSIKWYEYQNGGVTRGLKNRDTWRKLWYDYMGKPLTNFQASEKNFYPIEDLPEELCQKKFWITYPENSKMQRGGRTEGKIWEDSFFDHRLQFYSDYISKPELARFGCSRLSPYLAWGCISVREVYQRSIELKKTSPYKKQLSAFRSRLRWQAHFIQKFEMEPRIEFEAFNKGYLKLDQPRNEVFVTAWKDGKTGYPLVDASIRAVKETGYLNFRMRTMCVSFLLHHLFQHFSTSASWLAQQFLDFEPGIHYAQFQMQAGLTATNTLRIYNPTKNAIDHDPEAVFIKKWVPELSDLPTHLAIEPWECTPMENILYEFEPAITYPDRIVDISETRAFALKELYGLRKDKLTQKEKQRILNTHTLKQRFA